MTEKRVPTERFKRGLTSNFLRRQTLVLLNASFLTARKVNQGKTNNVLRLSLYIGTKGPEKGLSKDTEIYTFLGSDLAER